MDWFDLIQWAAPVVGGVVGWWVARINRRVDSQKQLLDTLDRQANDIAGLYEEMGFIRRAVEKRNACRYLPVCPVDVELRKQKRNYRQPQPHNRQRNGPDSYNIENPDGTPDASRPPPEPP